MKKDLRSSRCIKWKTFILLVMEVSVFTTDSRILVISGGYTIFVPNSTMHFSLSGISFSEHQA